MTTRNPNSRKTAKNRDFNRNLYFPQSTFLAMIRYNEQAQELFITFRKCGKQFRYDNVPADKITQALRSPNRIGAISQLIRGYAAEYVQTLAPEQLYQQLLPTKTFNWLAR